MEMNLYGLATFEVTYICNMESRQSYFKSKNMYIEGKTPLGRLFKVHFRVIVPKKRNWCEV